MTIRVRLALWYLVILLFGLLLIGGLACYEMYVAHPTVARALEQAGHTPLEELGEVLLFGGLPALVLAFGGGWFLMRRALLPVTTLTRAVERVQAETLRQELPRSGNGDELDRLTEVFNSMMARLDISFTHTREFTLHASHELKTPLTILRGQIELRLRDSEVPTADRELFADQLDEIARLTKIVDSLTFLARADSGQLAFATDPVRLDQLVRDSFADAQLLGRSAGLQVELAGCDETTVRGDRHRLKQLLLNLTDNAIKYNQPAGCITLSLWRNNGAAELTVANTGPGIAPEKLPRVFDRFYRGDPAHHNAIEGCGMGLSIAQWIVKAHQGTIQITSSRDGLTAVNIRLPAAAPSPSPA